MFENNRGVLLLGLGVIYLVTCGGAKSIDQKKRNWIYYDGKGNVYLRWLNLRRAAAFYPDKNDGNSQTPALIVWWPNTTFHGRCWNEHHATMTWQQRTVVHCIWMEFQETNHPSAWCRSRQVKTEVVKLNDMWLTLLYNENQAMSPQKHAFSISHTR